MLGAIEAELQQNQSNHQKMIEKFLTDVEKQGFTVSTKKGGNSCVDCRNTLEAKNNDFYQTKFCIKDSTSSSEKHFAIVDHCNNVECVIASTMKIPQLETMTQQERLALSEEEKRNPIFKLQSIAKTWEAASLNNKNKEWLQKSLKQIEEIETIVQANEKRILEDENATEEEIAKVSEAVSLMRALGDKLKAYKRKTKVFENLKANLEETEGDRSLRAKNDELQKCQDLSSNMNANIAALKLEAAELAEKSAFNRIQKLEQLTNAVDMKAIAEAKNIVSEHRQNSDTKIVMQTQLAMEVNDASQKLNDLGFNWLTLNVDKTFRNTVLLDPLPKDSMDALIALTEMTTKVIQAKAEQRNAKKQLLQIKLDVSDSIKREAKKEEDKQTSEIPELANAKIEIERLKKDYEILNKINEEKTHRITLLETANSNKQAEIDQLNITLTATNELLEQTLSKDSGTTGKKQKRGDLSDNAMNQKKQKAVQFSQQMDTNLDTNPATPTSSPKRTAVTPPRQSQLPDAQDELETEPAYSPCSPDRNRGDTNMPDLEPPEKKSEDTPTAANLKKVKALVEQFQKSTATVPKIDRGTF